MLCGDFIVFEREKLTACYFSRDGFPLFEMLNMIYLKGKKLI